jgi:hypothetical protein
MQTVLNSAFLMNQIRHWLATPTNSYLGSGYGIDIKSYLHKPMSTFDGDAIIDKLRRDIPALGALPRTVVNIYFENQGLDGKLMHIAVGDNVFSVAA